MAKDDKAPVTGAELVPVVAQDFGEFTGLGFETDTAADYVLPYLRVSQSNSPQVEEEICKAGDIFNTALRRGFKSLGFVPSQTIRKFVRWTPRGEGGAAEGSGFQGAYEATDKIVIDAVKAAGFEDPDKVFGKLQVDTDDLVDTRYVYGIAIDLDTDEECPAAIAFSSTGIQGYKQWKTLAKLQTYLDATTKRRLPYPFPFHVYKLTTVKQKNAKGTFWNYAVEFANGTGGGSRLTTADPRFISAVELAKQVKSGAAKVDHAAGGGAGAGGGKGGNVDDEIPF